jgi:rsbT co-antagonist protein RsbR
MNDQASVRPPPSAPPQSLEGDLMSSIGEILDVLRAVARGELQHRLVPKYEDTHPVGALALSVNVMVDALAEAKSRSASYQEELKDKILAIERQQVAIAELSTPIIEVWKGVLCVPVIGILDSARTSEMTSSLLSMIVQKQARCALVDITGIEAMDTRAVDHFLRMARAVRLLGAKCILSGVHPNISQTIVHMGIDLHGLETHRTMRDALRQYVLQTAAASKAARRKAPRKQ